MDINHVRTAASLLGDKWTPQLICALSQNESLRFCRLQDAVGGINPRTLTSRLIKLEDEGVIDKHISGAACEYSLTQRGQDMIPILRAMDTWSQKHSHPSAHLQV